MGHGRRSHRGVVTAGLADTEDDLIEQSSVGMAIRRDGCVPSCQVLRIPARHQSVGTCPR